MERRLAAILSADVVGYSRLMGEDEIGTLSALKAHRAEFIDPEIARHSGRLVKLMGDGALVEFASVVDAVECARSIQRGMIERNVGVAEDQRIEFRIGVNVGDIIVEGDDIYGDGVNVAARIEALAEPGGICISRTARDQVRDKLDITLGDMGEVEVKNIARPVRIFRVPVNDMEGSAVSAAPATALPDKPSIAVLPFDNMSGDPEQEFFADGLTEDILTALSRFHGLFVISRNSAFVYKGKATNVQQVAKDLGAQYVVEGSVRKAGNRVRISVQLIDAEQDRHIWAERYDRDLEDIFAVQDEVTTAIVATLPGRVDAATQERAERKRPENMAAHEFVMAGKTLHHRSTKADNEEAQRLLDRAMELDPKYAHAHSWKACTLAQSWVHGWCDDRDETWDKAQEHLQLALALDDDDSDVHRVLAAVNLTRGDFDKASYHQGRGLSLNPNDDLIVVQQGEILTWLGQPEEGIEWIDKAMRLNPFHPERFWGHLGRAHYMARQYSEAISDFKRISVPDSTHHSFLAASYAQLGDEAAAKAHSDAVLKQDPDFTVSSYLAMLHYNLDSDRDNHGEGLLKAGLPA
ncbi:MAG: adenylate/guanylate cyclase domain-containing protein [Alphaproteobacteria bacterium]